MDATMKKEEEPVLPPDVQERRGVGRELLKLAVMIEKGQVHGFRAGWKRGTGQLDIDLLFHKTTEYVEMELELPRGKGN